MAEKEDKSVQEITEEKGGNRNSSPNRFKSRLLGSEKRTRKTLDKKDDWPKKNYFEVTCFDVADGSSTAKMVNLVCHNSTMETMSAVKV